MPFVVLDLEMSGPDPEWNDIIQIGACLYDDEWNEISRYLEEVYPENIEAFTQSAEKVHGLSLSDLEDAPTLFEILEDFEDWIIEDLNLTKFKKMGDSNSKLLRDVVVCGQSVIYDINFLKYGYKKNKMPWPFSNKLIDLHTLAYFYFKILNNNGVKTTDKLSLGEISSYFGYARAGSEHNALEDAVLTAKCLKRIFDDSMKLKLNK